MAAGDGEVIVSQADFQVVDESADWIVVDKPAHLIVHPTNNKKDEPTLLGGLEALLAYELNNGSRLSIINRLDRETSGIVLVAKNKSAARTFGRAMERRQIHKEYSAIVFGWPDWDDCLVDEPVLRKGEVEPSPIWVKQAVHPEGRVCRTHFKVRSRVTVSGRPVSLLHVVPETGRMHQIRVHAAHLGYPLVGDKIYGPDESCYLRFIESGWDREMEQLLMLQRHALHACRMGLEVEGAHYCWQTPLAADLEGFLMNASPGSASD